jgi:hypothetical protein
LTPACATPKGQDMPKDSKAIFKKHFIARI